MALINRKLMKALKDIESGFTQLNGRVERCQFIDLVVVEVLDIRYKFLGVEE
jgi:hypothetical protein